MTANTATAGQRITAAWLNTNIPGAWQAITPQNSWANTGAGSVTFQCRLFNSATVEVVGTLNPGTSANGTVVGQLPAGMIPATSSNVVISDSGGTGAGGTMVFFITNTGQIQIQRFVTGCTQVSVHFFVSLDA